MVTVAHIPDRQIQPAEELMAARVLEPTRVAGVVAVGVLEVLD
jgi:hypothetical protein